MWPRAFTSCLWVKGTDVGSYGGGKSGTTEEALICSRG